MSASRHDPVLREAAQKALGTPFGGLFDRVLTRAVERGVVHDAVDVMTVARVFPAMAYQQVAAQGRLVTEDDVQRVVDAVLLPALGQHAGPRQDTPTRSIDRRRRPT